MKNNKGITLIALIITIIVLLILTGVTITMVLGENGLLDKTKQVKNQHHTAKIKEEIELAITDIYMEEIPKGNTVTIESVLEELKRRNTLEDISIEEKVGVKEGELIEFGYDPEGVVIITNIEKDSNFRVMYQLEPSSYTNQVVKVQIKVNATSPIKEIKKPEELVEREKGIYEVSKNGSYPVLVELENGEKKEKEIIITNIDKEAPNSFTITAANLTETGFTIEGETQDKEANQISTSSGISHYEYYVNGNKYEKKEITNLSFGTYSVYASCYDKAGNRVTSNTIQVVVTEVIKVEKAVIRGSEVVYLDTNGNLRVQGKKLTNGTIFKDIISNTNGVLAIDSEGNLWKYGSSNTGIFGDGSVTAQIFNSFTKVNTQIKFKQIDIDYNHGIGIDIEGNIWTWGQNEEGQMGTGSITDYTKALPFQKITIDAKIKKVEAGNRVSFALDEEGNIWTWGNKQDTGLQASTNVVKPTKVSLDITFKDISSTFYNTLALDEQGNIWGWGDNSNGQIGNGSIGRIYKPIKLERETKFKKIDRGAYTSSAIDTEGNIWVFGKNNGQMGIEQGIDMKNPVKIESQVKFRETTQYTNEIYAIDIDGNVWYTKLNALGFYPLLIK